MLRVVAVACLGQLGDQSHIPMLEEYRLSPDIRVRTAVRSAINNLKDES
jgi:HEAT repeat protein